MLEGKEKAISYAVNTGTLKSINLWFRDLLEFLEDCIAKLKVEPKLCDYHRILYNQLLKVRRLVITSTSFFVETTEGNTQSLIDSYYPIYKTLFELLVEYVLVIGYKNEFENSRQDWEQELLKRIMSYTKLYKMKKNFSKLFFQTLPDDLLNKLPSSLREMYDNGKSASRKEIEEKVSIELGVNGIKSLEHWFPFVDSAGKEFLPNHEKLKAGSLKWRCKYVLPKVFTSKVTPYLPQNSWEKHYEGIYELLNVYAHPHLGYYDSLLPEQERLFDLLYIQASLVMLFTMEIIPTFYRELPVSPNSDLFNKLNSSFKDPVHKILMCSMIIASEE